LDFNPLDARERDGDDAIFEFDQKQLFLESLFHYLHDECGIGLGSKFESELIAIIEKDRETTGIGGWHGWMVLERSCDLMGIATVRHAMS
jgi:hypothetical protein